MPFQQTEEGCRIEGAERWTMQAAGVTLGLQVTRPRAIPWLRIVRVPRFGRGLHGPAVWEIVEHLVQLAKERPVLRLHVEVWSEREAERALVAAACQAQGFRRSAPRSYSETAWLDISLPEDELLRSFHRSVRRNIRETRKRGLVVVPVTDPAASHRVRDIFRNTFSRTGGTPPFVDWEAVIAQNGRQWCRSHMVGLVPEEAPHSSKMLAFAVVFLHGDVAEFAHAGSAKDQAVRTPLLYAPTWELMVWARSRGARFWDFGGITPETAREEDSLAGISEFKRYFCQEVTRVGEEWVLEPRHIANAFANFVSRLR